jgi:glutaredoxin
MGRNASLIGLAMALSLGLLAADASAQMYSWKDAKGVTHFSDQPPPDEVKAVSRPMARGASQPALPYGLSEAVRLNPVVLYTTSSCEACDQGRTLLRQRGVPFTEKTVNSNEDQQALKAAGSEGRLPFLTIGRNSKVGFESTSWQEALTAAAYPQQSRLPVGWRQAPAVAAAPAAAPKGELAKDVVAAKPEQAPKKLPPLNAPPGFQF